jgi:hypothetical protein
MITFYCLKFETPPTWRERSPYLYPAGTGWPSYTPRNWVPLSSPLTTRRAAVEVFEPASAAVDSDYWNVVSHIYVCLFIVDNCLFIHRRCSVNIKILVPEIGAL